jgi:hypothetical protein
MKRVSAKRAAQLRQYSILRAQFMAEHPDCQRCGREATEVHHRNGRNNERLNRVEDWIAICRECHCFIHAHPKAARLAGLLV